MHLTYCYLSLLSTTLRVVNVFLFIALASLLSPTLISSHVVHVIVSLRLPFAFDSSSQSLSSVVSPDRSQSIRRLRPSDLKRLRRRKPSGSVHDPSHRTPSKSGVHGRQRQRLHKAAYLRHLSIYLGRPAGCRPSRATFPPVSACLRCRYPDLELLHHSFIDATRLMLKRPPAPSLNCPAHSCPSH